MNWYLTKLVFQITCGDGNHTMQFDEQLRLVSASNAAEAIEKAKEIGHREAETFLNNRGKLVQWKFINVYGLFPLEELQDGAEVYSTIQEPSNVLNYLEMINKRAAGLINTIVL